MALTVTVTGELMKILRTNKSSVGLAFAVEPEFSSVVKVKSVNFVVPPSRAAMTEIAMASMTTAMESSMRGLTSRRPRVVKACVAQLVNSRA